MTGWMRPSVLPNALAVIVDLTMWCGDTCELHGDDFPKPMASILGAHIANGAIFGEYSSRSCGINLSTAPSNPFRLAILAQRGDAQPQLSTT